MRTSTPRGAATGAGRERLSWPAGDNLIVGGMQQFDAARTEMADNGG